MLDQGEGDDRIEASNRQLVLDLIRDQELALREFALGHGEDIPVNIDPYILGH